MAPYRHYSSKDELLAAVAEEGFKDLAQAMDSSIDLFGDPQYRLRAFVRTYLTFALGNRALYRLMFGADLQNRSRFSRLVAASQECCSRCVSVVAPEVDPDGKERCLPRKAIATWSFAHGLASLALDGLVEFPQISNPKFSHELDQLLAATDLT